MQYRATHEIRFRYDAPVHLAPHTIRLRPRSDSWQRLERFDLQLRPEPVRLAEAVDAEGNQVAHASFSGATDTLVIRSEFEVETLRRDPFDYLVLDERALRLPLSYPSELRPHLAQSIRRQFPSDRAVEEFAAAIASRAEGRTLPFLAGLSSEIARTHDWVVRPHGDAAEPGATLRARRGACRDLAVLFLDCCRSQGIAVRFVSGYQEDGRSGGEQQMHAWAEVYLPGGGWRGYDPTQGLAVADRHVAVAASAEPRLAAPIEGAFGGGAAALPMEYTVRMSRAGQDSRSRAA